MLKIFAFIDIWFVKQDIQKWSKIKICSKLGSQEDESVFVFYFHHPDYLVPTQGRKSVYEKSYLCN